MIETILALPVDDAGARTMVWRQLVDIIAQGGDSLDPALRSTAHDRIAMLRPLVRPGERRSAAASLAGRATTAEAVAIFAMDEPAIAAPMLGRAALSDSDWAALLPTLPSTSRAILRNRRDLSPAVERALASFGSSDYALPGTAPVAPESASQIRVLVERIEAFRSQTPPAQIIEQPLAVPPAPPSQFAFETDFEGTIDWIEGILRTPLIGLSIAEAAAPRGDGVDGQAAGAFRRRAPFRDARLIVGGDSVAAGDWLIAAMPVFNPRDGRFTGYHGNARRPRPEERLAHRGGQLPSTPLDAGSLRQLVHELRTPLNAIQGFAEMIEQQILGPAAASYRERAQAIVGESRRLLDVVDDLDAGARLDSERFENAMIGKADAGTVAAKVVATLAPSLARRDIGLAGHFADDAVVAIAAPQLERIAHRLIVAASGLARAGETIAVDVGLSGPAIILRVGRPASLAGRDEAAMLDPGFGPEGEWPDAPLLGLGFTLRLIGNLAREAKGSFAVQDDAFVLSLPPVALAAARQGDLG